MASRAARLQQLKEARENKGSRRFDIEEYTSVYDEVDEEGYKKVVRSRLDRDDFVVDDNGEGYADDGREEDWNDGRDEYESEMDEDDGQPRGKAAKKKHEEEQKQQEKIRNGINKYFNAKVAGAVAPKPKPIKSVDDDAFMADLLGEVDVNVNAPRHTTRGKGKPEMRRKRLSPPLPDARPSKTARIDSSQAAYQVDTPPAESHYTDDAFIQQDDDAAMSDPLPSSPVAKALQRKSIPSIKPEPESDDDDIMEVAQSVGQVASAGPSVNLAGKRPVVRLKQETYPSPASSSPVAPANVDRVDPDAWNSVTDKLNILSSPAAPKTVSYGKLLPEHALEEDGSLRMFWTDYTDINGSLCLFGKVKDKKTGSYVSCFVKVDNIMRKLYFLPREYRQKHGRATNQEVDMSDVYKEVDGIMSSYRVGTFKIKPSSRKYAFEMPDIPKEADYLKLLYPYNKLALNNDLNGETFSHVFGATTALFEQFVLWKNIMGPCWLNIEGADFSAVNNASWCKLEALVTKPQAITVVSENENLEAPTLTLMSISLRTTYNAKDNKQEILLASARVYENVSLTETTPADKLPSKTFTIMRPVSTDYPVGFKIEADKHRGMIGMERNEAALLSKFLAMLSMSDPDVLMGHKLDDIDYGLLLNRMRERNTPGWHRIGRLKRSQWPKNMGKGGGSFFVERQLVAGRLLCDLGNDMGKSLMTKCQSWSLTEMCDLYIGERRVDLDQESVLKTWTTTSKGMMNYIRHCETDTYFISALALKVQMLPLTKVLTNLAGNSWARTLSGTRAERNEYILLHEFYRNKYICPDKVWGKGKQKVEVEAEDGEEGVDAKKKDKYKGGLVFEPEKGLYDKFILVMDFNSLYPSIIQEYNICFTTVDRSEISEEEERVPEVPDAEQPQGILPKLIATLVLRRREVKKLMKDKNASADQLATWDIKQLALKLTANSMYGCLGYTKSRFYARPLAMLTTHKGREILRSTKELAESAMLRVIYGDTDSVMINTNMDNIQDALKIGAEFKKQVNDRYRLLEIDVDNVFRRILLHAKKKYAAINMVERDGKFIEKLEVKGLDMRRREYCQLSKDTSSKLLNFLLSGEDPETVVENIHEYLRNLATEMREFKIDPSKYTIYTQLGKAPQDYPNSGSMPSVQVALKQIAKGKHVKAKDVMSFIITGESSGSAEAAAKNAYPREDVIKQDSGLKPDIDYYLHKQILPPVERLCAPISGTNVTLLADCLGLDTSKYRVSSLSINASTTDGEIQPLESQISDSVRFKDALPLQVKCRMCKASSSFRGLVPITETNANEKEAILCHDGITCSNAVCGKVLPNISIVAQMESQIRQHIARYYANFLVCDDPSCGARTRQISVYGHRCLGPKGLGHGCLGKMHQEYTEKMLYNQLLFLSLLFDADKAKEKADKETREGRMASEKKEKLSVLAEINRERWETVRGVVRAYLEKNGRQWVQMDSLFSFALTAGQ